MNCVNCGAPPRRGSAECAYCETALAVKVPRANQAGFETALRAIRAMRFDNYKVDAIESMRGSFTAGQVLAILKEFRFDNYRLDAAEHLAPLTLNRNKLLGGAELFHFDNYRAEYIQLIGYTGSGDGVEDVPREATALSVGRFTYTVDWATIIPAILATLIMSIAFRGC